jgi:hemolysin III
MLLAGVGLPTLVIPAVLHRDLTRAVGFGIYGLSLLLVFFASTLFHMVQGEEREVARRFDRAAIYLFIGGTFTPIALLRLPGALRWPVLVCVWIMAVYGIAREWRPMTESRRRAIGLYVVMGLLTVVVLQPLAVTLGPGGLTYMIAGAIFYAVGGAIVRLAPFPRSHDIWHALALAGAACHFAMIYLHLR